MRGIDNILEHPIQIEQLDLLVIDLPQKMTFKSGIGVRKSRKAMIVRWHGGNGVVGYGECSARPDPFYSAEFLDASILVLQNFVATYLGDCQTYGDVLNVLRRVRGWPFTKSALEFAMHDWVWHSTGANIFELFDHPKLDEVPVGISIGLLPDLEATINKIQDSKAEGYHRLKFKVNPDFDVDTFLEARHLLEGEYVSFDANGTLSESDEDLVKALSSFGNAIEQPFPPYDIKIQEALKAKIPGLKICLDESIKSLSQLQQAHRLGMLDELNLKIGRVGGLYDSMKIVEYCFEHELPVWIGGMFETGIGRTLNLQVAAFLKDAVAHDLSPSSRYFVEDVLENPVKMSKNGYIRMEGLNRTVNPAILDKYTVQKIEIPIKSSS